MFAHDEYHTFNRYNLNISGPIFSSPLHYLYFLFLGSNLLCHRLIFNNGRMEKWMKPEGISHSSNYPLH